MGCGELDAERVQSTIRQLQLRIRDRFPDSGLSEICRELSEISQDVAQTQRWISQPIYILRLVIGVIVGALMAALVVSVGQLELERDSLTLTDFVQVTEAGLNELVLIGAGIVFLVTIESRAKRRRVTKAINRLRCIAHIIDAHQLTKDPDGVATVSQPTAHSPTRKLSAYELGRYLDYCSEMLSLVSKLGFLYVQHFDDPVTNTVANELESLSTGLARKIWQKIMILDRILRPGQLSGSTPDGL